MRDDALLRRIPPAPRCIADAFNGEQTHPSPRAERRTKSPSSVITALSLLPSPAWSASEPAGCARAQHPTAVT